MEIKLSSVWSLLVCKQLVEFFYEVMLTFFKEDKVRRKKTPVTKGRNKKQ